LSCHDLAENRLLLPLLELLHGLREENCFDIVFQEC
jgi:hypothetical protein